MSEGPFSLFSELGMAQLVHSSKRKHSGRTIRSCITVRSNAADFALNAWDPGSFSPYPVGPPSTADDISVERGHHLRCERPLTNKSQPLLFQPSFVYYSTSIIFPLRTLEKEDKSGSGINISKTD